MAWTKVSGTSATGTSGTTLAITIPSTTSGNLIVVCAGNYDGRSVSSVADNKGNTYTVVKNQADSGRGAGQAYCIDAFGAVTSVTITFSGTITGARGEVSEWSGNAASGVVGGSSSGSSGAGQGTAASVTSFVTISGSLIVANTGHSGNRTLSAGTGYTLLNASASAPGAAEYKAGADTSETAPGTISSNVYWSEVAVEYKAAAGVTFVPRLMVI